MFQVFFCRIQLCYFAYNKLNKMFCAKKGRSCFGHSFCILYRFHIIFHTRSLHPDISVRPPPVPFRFDKWWGCIWNAIAWTLPVFTVSDEVLPRYL